MLETRKAEPRSGRAVDNVNATDVLFDVQPTVGLDFGDLLLGVYAEGFEVVGVFEEGEAEAVVLSCHCGAWVHKIEKVDVAVDYAEAEVLDLVNGLSGLIQVVEEEGYVMLFAVIVGGCAVNVDYHAEKWVVEASEVAEVVAPWPAVLVDSGFHRVSWCLLGFGLKSF